MGCRVEKEAVTVQLTTAIIPTPRQAARPSVAKETVRHRPLRVSGLVCPDDIVRLRRRVLGAHLPRTNSSRRAPRAFGACHILCCRLGACSLMPTRTGEVVYAKDLQRKAGGSLR